MNRAWLGSSIRLRIAVLIMAIGLSGGAIFVARMHRQALTDNVEAAIRLRGDDVAALIAAGELPASLGQSDGEVAAVQVVDGRGVVVSSTTNVAQLPVMSGLQPARGAAVLERVGGLPIDDEPFLVLVQSVTAGGDGYAVYVAGSLEPVDESVDALASILWVGTPSLILLVAAGTWVAVGRALAPVEAMRREVATIGTLDPGRRVPEPRRLDEIGRSARTMNAMLERLQDASERQERFVADAAHELRSPLASMRVQLEVASRANLAEADVADLLAEVVRLQRLSDDLLAVARDHAGMPPRRDLLDLDDIVLEEARWVRSDAAATIDTGAVSGGQVRGDPDQLRRAVRNLLDNACRHARQRVVVVLREDDVGVELAVADDGLGIAPVDRERIFERFARVDDARDRGSGGAGLGLAIARAIVESHGGTVAVDSTYKGGARFIVRLPRGGDAPRGGCGASG